MSRIEQVNELIKRELADLINKEICFESGLVTVSFVDCSPDCKDAKVGVSVLPINLAGTALKSLRRKSGVFAQILRKRTRLRRVPHFSWEIDNTEEEAGKIEDLLEQIKQEETTKK